MLAILFLGCLLIFAGGLFIYTAMWNLFDYSRYDQKVAFQILNLYRVVNSAPEPQALVKKPGPFYRRIEITDVPHPAAQSIAQPTVTKVIAWVADHPKGGVIALQLHSGAWLNISMQLVPPPFWYPFIGFALLSMLLLLSLFFLCMWVINRLYQPLANLSKVVGNIDPEAKAFVATGNQDVDHVLQTFNELQSRITRLLHMRTQMLAAIAHDLRTPITRLKLRIEYFPEHDQYQKALADLVEMENMINSVLLFARQENFKGPTEEFDLNALLESLVHDFSDLGMPVSYQSEDKIVPFYGSLSALKRAFTNLIDNAIKYGESVVINLRSDDKHIYIHIDDQGPGIPQEQLEQVFDPFHRVEQSRSKQTGGVGLGLTIARDIIFAHHGEIQLQNRVPNGLRVLIILRSSQH